MPGLGYPSCSPITRIMSGGKGTKSPEWPDNYAPDEELNALERMVSEWKTSCLKRWVVVWCHYFAADGYGLGDSGYIAAGCGRATYYRHLADARRLVSAWRRQYRLTDETESCI